VEGWHLHFSRDGRYQKSVFSLLPLAFNTPRLIGCRLAISLGGIDNGLIHDSAALGRCGLEQPSSPWFKMRRLLIDTSSIALLSFPFFPVLLLSILFITWAAAVVWGGVRVAWGARGLPFVYSTEYLSPEMVSFVEDSDDEGDACTQ